MYKENIKNSRLLNIIFLILTVRLLKHDSLLLLLLLLPLHTHLMRK